MRCLAPPKPSALEAFQHHPFAQKHQIEFTVVFPTKQIGLGFKHLAKTPYQAAVKQIVQQGPRKGYAATYNAKTEDQAELLVPGLQILRINDKDMARVPYVNVLRRLQTARRPVVVTFFDANSASYNQKSTTIELQDIMDSHTELAHEHRKLSLEIQQEEEKHKETINSLHEENLRLGQEIDELRAEHEDMAKHASELHDRLIQAQRVEREAEEMQREFQILKQEAAEDLKRRDKMNQLIESHKDLPNKTLQHTALVEALLEERDAINHQRVLQKPEPIQERLELLETLLLQDKSLKEKMSSRLEDFESQQQVLEYREFCQDHALNELKELLCNGVMVQVHTIKRFRSILRRVLYADTELNWISWVKPSQKGLLQPIAGAMFKLQHVVEVNKGQDACSLTLVAIEPFQKLTITTESPHIGETLVNGFRQMIKRMHL